MGGGGGNRTGRRRRACGLRWCGCPAAGTQTRWPPPAADASYMSTSLIYTIHTPEDESDLYQSFPKCKINHSSCGAARRQGGGRAPASGRAGGQTSWRPEQARAPAKQRLDETNHYMHHRRVSAAGSREIQGFPGVVAEQCQGRGRGSPAFAAAPHWTSAAAQTPGGARRGAGGSGAQGLQVQRRRGSPHRADCVVPPGVAVQLMAGKRRVAVHMHQQPASSTPQPATLSTTPQPAPRNPQPATRNPQP